MCRKQYITVFTNLFVSASELSADDADPLDRPVSGGRLLNRKRQSLCCRGIIPPAWRV